MRTLLIAFLLLAAPATAAAKPLDADPRFARNGVFLRDEPRVSTSVIALRDGGTLHATDGGLMRLGARGRLRGFQKSGATELAPGLAVGIRSQWDENGKPALETWPLDASGRAGESHVIALARGATPVRLVRRRGGYAALVWLSGSGMRLFALTRDGKLDTKWGRQGIRRVTGDFEDIALAAGRDGSLVVTSTSAGCYEKRKVRAQLRVRRFGPDGSIGPSRRLKVGGRSDCPLASTGDALIDGRGRVLIAGHFGASVSLIRLTRDLRRDRTFTARVRADVGWTLPPRLERTRGGGYALGFTGGEDVPRAGIALFDSRGRRRALRRLKVTKDFPTSVLADLAIDRRGGIVAAGSLHDTEVFIREDYGVPHVAVWRLRTTR